MAKKFPDTIFVKSEQDGDNSYLIADANVTSLVEMGDKIKIAVYKRVEYREVQGVVSSRRVEK